MSLRLRLKQNWFQLLCLCIIGFGIFLRCSHLGGKYFWHDEVYTGFYLSGNAPREIRAHLQSLPEFTAGSLFSYQHLSADKSLNDTVQALASHDPHHPPLYYVLLWLWARLFGDSMGALRGFSALAGVLLLPAFYWLCRELFDERRAPWLGTALVAVSPFYVLYSQDARPYALWLLTIVAASAALLRALRSGSAKAWRGYGALLLFGLWVHLLFLPVLLAHALFVLMVRFQKLEWPPSAEQPVRTRSFWICCVLALLSFVPWLVLLATHVGSASDNTSWTGGARDLGRLVIISAFNLSTLVFDPDPYIPFVLRWPFSLLMLGAVIYTVRMAPRRASNFALLLIGCSVLPFLLVDLVQGGHRVTIARFIMPCWVGVSLCLTYLLAQQLRSSIAMRRTIWVMMTALLIFSGAASCVLNQRAPSWWLQGDVTALHRAAATMNSNPTALLVTDVNGDNLGELFALSRFLRPEVRVSTSRPSRAAEREIYLFRPDEETLRQLQAENRVRTTKSPTLWQFVDTPQTAPSNSPAPVRRVPASP